MAALLAIDPDAGAPAGAKAPAAAATWPDFSDGNLGPDSKDDNLGPDSTESDNNDDNNNNDDDDDDDSVCEHDAVAVWKGDTGALGP